MDLDLKTVAAFIRKAETEELLDRVTVYRDGMEPAAVDLMENELARRGYKPDAIAEHGRQRRETVLFHEDGTAIACSLCRRPAVVRIRGWYRIGARSGFYAATDSMVPNVIQLVGRKLLGWLPLFPWTFFYCDEHAPAAKERGDESTEY